MANEFKIKLRPTLVTFEGVCCDRYDRRLKFYARLFNIYAAVVIIIVVIIIIIIIIIIVPSFIAPFAFSRGEVAEQIKVYPCG
jgi:hypothetical protein